MSNRAEHRRNTANNNKLTHKPAAKSYWAIALACILAVGLGLWRLSTPSPALGHDTVAQAQPTAAQLPATLAAFTSSQSSLPAQLPTKPDGHWVRADQLKKGQTVLMPDGRRLVVKNIVRKTVMETKTQEVVVPPPAPKPRRETNLDLDLSQGGNEFDETLIVPASQAAVMGDGSSRPADELKPGDHISMTGQNIALVKKAETSLYTPPLPQKPDKNGNTCNRVIGTTKHLTDTLLYLRTAHELIKTTPEHPFFVHGKGWTQAGKLQQGEQIETQTGQFVPVVSTEVRHQPTMVYNLDVEGAHDFFVGKDKLLVHIGACVPELARSFRELLKDYEADASNWEVVRSERVPSINSGNKGGESLQELFRHKETAEEMTRHTLFSRDGSIFEPPHFRPTWK